MPSPLNFKVLRSEFKPPAGGHGFVDLEHRRRGGERYLRRASQRRVVADGAEAAVVQTGGTGGLAPSKIRGNDEDDRH